MAIFKWADLVVLIPASVLAAVINIKFSLSTYFLEDLTQYVPTGNTPPGVPVAGEKKKGNKTGDKKASAGLGDAENLITYPLGKAQIYGTLFHNILDQLVFTSLIALFVGLAYPLGARYLGDKLGGILAPFLPTPLLLVLGIALMALSALARVDFFSQYSGADAKGYVIIFAILGFIASAAMFSFEQHKGAFAWDAEDGAAAIGDLFRHLAEQRAPGLPLEEAVAALTPTPVFVKLGLSAFAAAISGLFVASAMRFVRAFRLQQDVPEWAEDQLKKTAFGTFKMNLLLIMPAVAALTWSKLLFTETLGLDEFQGQVVRACAAVLAGVLFLSTAKIVLQRYLDTALITWHSLKHGVAKRSSNERLLAAERAKLMSAAVRNLVGKAAVQVVAPGIFFLSLGLVLGMLCLHPATLTTKVAVDTQRLITCLAGFCIWWSGVCWILYCSVAMWLFRTGTLQM